MAGNFINLKEIARISFVPADLYAILLLVMASLPREDLQRIQAAPSNPLLATILSDPVMHFIVLGFLTLLICMGFYRESKWSIPLAKVAVIAFGYGLLIEVYQGILPWRSFGLDDLVWNAAGVLFFLVLVGMARLLMEKKPEKRESVL